jgi:hypothetical protein
MTDPTHYGPCGKSDCPHECINCENRTSLKAEKTNCIIECKYGTKQYVYRIDNFYKEL